MLVHRACQTHERQNELDHFGHWLVIDCGTMRGDALSMELQGSELTHRWFAAYCLVICHNIYAGNFYRRGPAFGSAYLIGDGSQQWDGSIILFRKIVKSPFVSRFVENSTFFRRIPSTLVVRTEKSHGRPWSTMADLGRPWSTMVDHGRPWSTMFFFVFQPRLKSHDVMSSAPASDIPTLPCKLRQLLRAVVSLSRCSHRLKIPDVAPSPQIRILALRNWHHG